MISYKEPESGSSRYIKLNGLEIDLVSIIKSLINADVMDVKTVSAVEVALRNADESIEINFSNPNNKEQILKKIKWLQNQISEGIRQESLLWRRREELTNEVNRLRDILKIVEKTEFCEYVDAYMLENFGIISRREGNVCYLVFDKYGNYLETWRQNKDFKYNDDLEMRLNRLGLYGHSASSWYDRMVKFYSLSFQEQLMFLDWKFNENGEFLVTRTKPLTEIQRSNGL